MRIVDEVSDSFNLKPHFAGCLEEPLAVYIHLLLLLTG